MATGPRQPPGPDLLDDLCTRFILNVPASELESFEKFMFLVEQAHWFYEDFCRERDPQLKSLSLKEFTGLLFGHCPSLTPFAHQLDAIHARFARYKQGVPTMGAILLDPSMDKVLLVRGISQSHGWGFPKGKVAKDEADHECAIREVQEETGFDITSRLLREDFIEVHLGLGKGEDGVRQQRCKLFIVRGVAETTCFLPTVKGEIGAFGWHLVEELPASSEAVRQGHTNADGSRHRFYMVHPFVKQLRAWIRRKRAQEAPPGQGGKGKAAKAAARAAARQAAAAAAAAAAAGPTPAPSPAAPSAAGQAAPPPPLQPPEPAPQPPTAPAPAPVLSPVPPPAVFAGPGQAWADFRFRREEILQQLLTPGLPA